MNGTDEKGLATMSKEKEPRTPSFILDTGKEKLICTPDNTMAFLYEDEKYDHIFYMTQQDEERMFGYHIFRHVLGDQFDTLVRRMINDGYIVNNEDELSELDFEAYNRSKPKEFTVPYPDTEWGNTKNEQAQKWGAFVAYLAERIANGDEL